MSESVASPYARAQFSWSRALTAGLIATVVMTVVMMLTGMNIMKMLGEMIAPGAGTAAQYTIGGAMHLMIGLVYGIIYAWLFGQVREWNPFVKGAVYGLAITGIALAAMPAMSALMPGGGDAGNPCGAAAGAGNPCGDAKASASNPCAPSEAGNPCAPEGGSAAMAQNPCAAENPCKAKAENPCAAHEAGNPCAAENPCAAKKGGEAGNACHAAGASNPCGGDAGNPCGGPEGPYSGLMSTLNHLIYALTLAFVYGRGATP